MFYVGIDVSKDKHDCHIFDSNGVIHLDNFSFKNNKVGFSSFLKILKSLDNSFFEKIKVGLESTGHYSVNLISFLEDNEISLTVLNPLTVSQSRRASSLRRTKTDKNDARYIAHLLVSDEFKTHLKTLNLISSLKSLTRARFRLNKEIQPLKNRYCRLIHIVFPEISEFFCTVYSSSVYAVLKELSSASHIAKCNITKLTNILKANSHGKHARAKAEELKLLAINSIGSSNIGDCIELKLSIDRIVFLGEQKKCYDKEINNIMNEINSPITSIPGIGTVLGATILAELGDVSKFTNSGQILAFAGAEPNTYESGKFVSTNNSMVKHGSRYLRHALFLATTMAYIHSSNMKCYIDKKRSQGKHYYVSISHGMKKLTRIIFAVLSKNILFTEKI